MSLGFHIIAGLAAAVFFLWRFLETHYSYQLVLAFWVLSTFGVYISRDRQYILALTGLQLAFFAIFCITWVLCRKKRKAAEEYCNRLRKQLERKQHD